MPYPASMRPVGRRAVMAAALPLVFIRSGPARAAEWTYRLATGSGINQLINARLEQAAGRIREATGGRLDIQPFPGTQLGSDDDQLAKLRAGATEFLNITGSRISSIAPASDLTNLGFVFPSREVLWPAMDGDFGRLLRARIETAGITIVSKASDNGFRQITSGEKPIRTPEDLQGFRIRLPDIAAFTTLFQALGAVPASAGFNDLRAKLQTHVIDGQENSLAAVDFAKLYEVQKYVALTDHIWDPFWLLANPQAMARLPEDVQAIVRREFDRASVEQREDVVRQETMLRKSLVDKGLTLVEVDKAPFRAAIAKAGFYTGWKPKFAPDLWAALETVTGPLA